jgi:small conductance mechanosensitive channel
MDFTHMGSLAQQGYGLLIALGIKVVEAIALWIVGRWLIGFSVSMIGKAMTRQKIDPTLIRYINNTVAAILNIVLVVAILGFFGVETTSFAALLAAAGVAIGMAWSGLLGNFAAGVFIIILQPFKVGDFILAGGVMGTVEEVGLFVTSINTLDNIRNIVGNGKILGDVIQNFSTNPFRRVDLQAQLSHSVDPHQAIAILKAGLAKIPNVMTDPAPSVEILTFTLAGPVLAVRPFCNNKDYWQVYFATNTLIKDAFGQAGFAVPEQHYMVRTAACRRHCGCAFSLITSATLPQRRVRGGAFATNFDSGREVDCAENHDICSAALVMCRRDCKCRAGFSKERGSSYRVHRQHGRQETRAQNHLCRRRLDRLGFGAAVYLGSTSSGHEIG